MKIRAKNRKLMTAKEYYRIKPLLGILCPWKLAEMFGWSISTIKNISASDDWMDYLMTSRARQEARKDTDEHEQYDEEQSAAAQMHAEQQESVSLNHFE